MNGLDVSKVGALRVAGWTWEQIAEAMELGCWWLRSQWRLHRNRTEHQRWLRAQEGIAGPS
jgi:hypothetical protein